MPLFHFAPQTPSPHHPTFTGRDPPMGRGIWDWPIYTTTTPTPVTGSWGAGGLRAGLSALIHPTCCVYSPDTPIPASCPCPQPKPWLNSRHPMRLSASVRRSCPRVTRRYLAHCCDGLTWRRCWMCLAPMAPLPSMPVATSHWRWWQR